MINHAIIHIHNTEKLPTKPTVQSGGYAIYERNNKAYFVYDGTRWIHILNFVSGLLFVILFINGIGLLFINRIAGAIMLLSALPFLLIILWGRKTINKIKSKDLDELDKLAIIDFNSKQLLDKHGQTLAPLEVVMFYKAWQITDSSRALEAKWPTGTVTLAKGLSLTGGSTGFFNYLVTKGLMKE